MTIATNMGFPRIGPHRELKKSVERYWAGKIDEEQLEDACRTIRQQNWQMQRDIGIDHIPSNDFSLYDHVLDTTAMVGAVPARYRWSGDRVDLDTYFAMARGIARDADSHNAPPMEMTKWFDTNYHYIVPEFTANQEFRLASSKLLDEFLEAKRLGIHTRPVLLGPVSYLLLGKCHADTFDKLDLLERILPIYEQVLRNLADVGGTWVQIDDPSLVLDLPANARDAFQVAYDRLTSASTELSLLLSTYFGALQDNLRLACQLPVRAMHLDVVRGREQLGEAVASIPSTMSLSLGVVDGRNVWRADLDDALALVKKAVDSLGSQRVFVAPSCSLLHCPYDLDQETGLDDETRGWLAFAKQKLSEVATLARAINEGEDSAAEVLQASREAKAGRERSSRVHNHEVQARVAAIQPDVLARRSPYEERKKAQRQRVPLPQFPTTTIGSFPQTSEIRSARAEFKTGNLSRPEYEAILKQQIEQSIRFQESIGLDVLVHGEAERSDMIEYFGELLVGFLITRHGWVQSYGTRCVKPPIIFGDVSRPSLMTVDWIKYAQSLTAKPVKGILTGPVTILQWSFVRDDQPRSETCGQIALALRDEVADLEAAGIPIIQIDEAAFREALPLRRADWQEYLSWAVDCFRLATCSVSDATQIHAHMCYAQFNDIIEAIGAMDADVIYIESARSRMELLDAFRNFEYPSQIGPGVYDIHSPRIPSMEEMVELLRKAQRVLLPDQLWVNPDCGLKTRRWSEIRPALVNMVAAAREIRAVRAGQESDQRPERSPVRH